MMDPNELAALYRKNSLGLYRFALQMCGRVAMAEEVTQDTFLVLIDRPGLYDPSKGAVQAFLFGVARNLVKRHLERDRKESYLEDTDEPPLKIPDDPLAGLTQRESLQALREAIAKLPPRYREVVILCDLQELSYENAAIAIGCAVGTVRSRLHRARNLLIEKMQTKCLV